MNKCITSTGVHDFVPRYDEVPKGGDINIKGGGMTAGEMREMTLTRVYVRDVCRNCGQTIERAGK